MSIRVSEVYEALIEAGASQEKAKAAAAAIPIGADLATKQDILELHKDIDILKLVVFRFPVAGAVADCRVGGQGRLLPGLAGSGSPATIPEAPGRSV